VKRTNTTRLIAEQLPISNYGKIIRLALKPKLDLKEVFGLPFSG
jgi:hypothetical protein